MCIDRCEFLQGFALGFHDCGKRRKTWRRETEIRREDGRRADAITGDARVIFARDEEIAGRGNFDLACERDEGAAEGLCKTLWGVRRFKIHVEFSADKEGLRRIGAIFEGFAGDDSRREVAVRQRRQDRFCRAHSEGFMDEGSVGVERENRDIVGIAGFHEDDRRFDADQIKIIEEACGGVISQAVIVGKEFFLGILGTAHEDKDMFHWVSWDRLGGGVVCQDDTPPYKGWE